ncbi:hypothetical protein ACS0TY_035259 [Phlomoides rotata]
MDRGNHHRVAQVDESDAMKTIMMTLIEKFDAFSCSSQKRDTPSVSTRETCSRETRSSRGQLHGKTNFSRRKLPSRQAKLSKSNHKGNFLKIHKEGTMPLQTFKDSSYNQNFKHHENFSYANQKAAVQFPPGFNPGAKPPNNEGRPSQDEVM